VNNKFFMYGTLKVGGAYDRFDSIRESADKATIGGSIFNLGPFPAIKLDGHGLVQGEVQTFKEEHLDRIMARLDEIESYIPEEPELSLYIRREVEATLYNKERVTAWVYEFRRPIPERHRIEEGIWLAPWDRPSRWM